MKMAAESAGGGLVPRVALPSYIDQAAIMRRDPQARVVALSGETMGTVWRARYLQAASDAEVVRGRIMGRLAEIVRQMSHWLPDSDLCRFNRLPAGATMALAPDFAAVMAAGLEVARASGGMFSPAMGALVDRWGFGPPGPVARAPDEIEIADLLPRCDARRLVLQGARLRQPGGVALDLSGIAKGYAVDAVAQMLRGLGVQHGLVEVGGELTGWGVQPDGQPWWVDMECPPGMILAPIRVALHGVSVATSGTYVRGEHNIHPGHGHPARSGVMACSVIHSSAMMADAWASALSVEEGDAQAMADRHGLAARWVLSDGREVMSAAMMAMLEG